MDYTKQQTMRNLSVIAREIKHDWTKVNFAAKPYLDVMFTLNSIEDRYIHDSAYDIVSRFLCNATSWRGEVARRVKKELNVMIKN